LILGHADTAPYDDEPANLPLPVDATPVGERRDVRHRSVLGRV